MCPQSQENICHNCDNHIQIITSYLYVTYYEPVICIPTHTCKWTLKNALLTASLLEAELKFWFSYCSY